MDDFVAESPDLSAFLIKAMETLAIIAEKLGRDMIIVRYLWMIL